jgi:hypothetical protein
MTDNVLTSECATHSPPTDTVARQGQGHMQGTLAGALGRFLLSRSHAT